jgi:nucleoside 2-deoxyribosyltransferase
MRESLRFSAKNLCVPLRLRKLTKVYQNQIRNRTSEIMNIYFAGSIRGGREDAALYARIIDFLKKYGTVFTEHIGDSGLTTAGDEGLSDRDIYDRDMDWLMASDVIVAEVTTVSLGVGYEIGRAVAAGKRVICLYRPQPGKRLSAMIAGSPGVTLGYYHHPEEADSIISGYFSEITINYPAAD